MPSPPPHRRPLTTKGEAIQLIDGLLDSLVDLGDVLDQESVQLRQGRLKEAMALSERKNDASRRFIHHLQAANANSATLQRLAPERIEAYHSGQERFNARLQTNLTILATSQALTDSLIQEIAAAVARSDQPSAYSASGTAIEPRSPNTARPINLSRSF